MQRVRVRRLTAVLVGVVICLTGAGTVLAEPPDVIRQGGVRDVDTFDPAKTDGSGYFAICNLFDQLVRFKQGPDVTTLELENDLAESYEINKAGTLYTFHLRKGVLFHKGYGELTSEDVKFTFERILDPKFGSPQRSVFSSIKEIRTPDKYTVEIELKSPSAGFMGSAIAYRGGYILSKRAVQEMGDAGTALNPIGTGPYVLESRVPGQSMTFVANYEYWRGVADIKRVVLNVIPDETTILTALLAGDLDYALLEMPEMIRAARQDPNLNLMISPGETRGLVVNCNTIPNRKVRQALLFALDRELIIEKVYFGIGELIEQTPLAQHLFGYEPYLAEYTYSPETAVRLLQEAGYSAAKPLVVRLLLRPADIGLATACAGFWEEVGVQTVIDVQQTAAFAALRSGKEDAWDLMITTPTRPDPALLLPQLYSPNIPSPNYARYNQVDNLIEAYNTTSGSDTATLGLLLSQIQMIVSVDLPNLYVLDTMKVTCTRKGLAGDVPNTHFWLMLWYFMHWE